MSIPYGGADGNPPFAGEAPVTPDYAGLRHAEPKSKWRRRWTRFQWRVLLLFLLIALFLLRDRVFIQVDSGHVLLVYYSLFGGTTHNRVGYEGLHILAPWDNAYLYVTRTQTLVSSMTVLSRNGVEVHLDAQIRLHVVPELVPYLHRQFGPHYVDTVIRPQLLEAVQKVTGEYLPEELYSSETGASATQIFANAKKLIGGAYVNVEDMTLLNIRLPERVQAAIQNKLEAQQNALAYDYRVQQEQKETERKLIEAKGLRAAF